MATFSPVNNTFEQISAGSVNPSRLVAQMHDADLSTGSFAEYTINSNGPNQFPPSLVVVEFNGWGIVPNNETVVFPKLRFQLDSITGTAADRSGRVTLSIAGPGIGLGINTFNWNGEDPPDGVQELSIQNTLFPTRVLKNSDFADNILTFIIAARCELFQHQEDGIHGGSFRFLEIYIEEQSTASPSPNDAEMICELF